MKRTSQIEIDELLERTHNDSERVRAEAVRALCPCAVKRNERRVWDRVLEMVADPSPKVRSHVFHLLGDGSPREREAQVAAAMERLTVDADERLRRRARKLLAHYRRTGALNVL